MRDRRVTHVSKAGGRPSVRGSWASCWQTAWRTPPRSCATITRTTASPRKTASSLGKPTSALFRSTARSSTSLTVRHRLLLRDAQKGVAGSLPFTARSDPGCGRPDGRRGAICAMVDGQMAQIGSRRLCGEGDGVGGAVKCNAGSVPCHRGPSLPLRSLPQITKLYLAKV